MSIDVQDLASKMFNAAWSVIQKDAPEVANYARGEFTKIALSIATIEQEQAAGEVDPSQAAILLSMQTNASRAVLLTSKGLALLAAEAAINAALGAVKDAVNTALGFALIAV